MTVKKAHGCMMVSPFAGAGSNSKGMFLLPRTKTEALGTCEAKEIRVNKGVPPIRLEVLGSPAKGSGWARQGAPPALPLSRTIDWATGGPEVKREELGIGRDQERQRTLAGGKISSEELRLALAI